MSKLPWFKLHGDVIDDPKLRLLAFEDRWHFIAICACKCNGTLDEKDRDLRLRLLTVALGLQPQAMVEVKR